MSYFLEQLIARSWNRVVTRPKHPMNPGSLDLGCDVVDGQVEQSRAYIAQYKRPEHIAILGKTGTGKSSLLKYMAVQDVQRGHGFCFFDLHGDATPALLRSIAAEEARIGQDLSHKVIVIEPADPDWSVGLNVLERRTAQQAFVQVAEFAQILKQRWHLDSFGARTEELLRNGLHVLSDNGLTLLELAPLLTNAAFRSSCLRKAENSDIRDYFESRYDQASEAMQAVMREAILNKISTFTADPHFKHLLGQERSTFSLIDAIDHGYWIFLNLDKGRLGEQAATLGSLFLTKLKNALFARRNRRLFTLYCDEIQNLVTFDSGIDALLSEARKFGISITSANQFLDQYPAQMRSAILAVGSHIFFQLSSSDADKIAAALDGGKTLGALLKNLPQRHMVLKVGSERWRQAVVPDLAVIRNEYTGLYNRSRQRWARRRIDIDREIRNRSRDAQTVRREALNDWE